MIGVVYLIHLERPMAHAQHYIGWCRDGPEERLATHREGKGSRLLRAVNAAQIPYDIVRIWKGDRNLERRLKNRKNAKRLCPVCRGGEG